MSHPAKFCCDRLNRCEDIAIFKFLKWRICFIFTHAWDHIRRVHVLGGLYRFANFSLNRQYSFENMQGSMFYVFRLKMPIHAPFGGVFGVNR